MTNLALTVPAPLAIDRDGDRFDTGEATHWLIKRWTGGRPGLIKDADGEPVLLDMKSGKTELRRAVGHEPGVFRLYPSDLEGNVLDSLYAEIEFMPGEYGQARNNDYLQQMCDRMFGALEQEREQIRAVMGIMSDVMRSQASALVDQPRASAEAIRALIEAIKVASGVDARERQLPAPQVDVDALASAVADALGLGDDDGESEPESKFSKFLGSPLFGIGANFLNGLLGPLVQLHQVRMKAKIDAETQQAQTTTASSSVAPAPAQPATATPATASTSAPARPTAQAQAEPSTPEPKPRPAPTPEPTEPEPVEGIELDDAEELDETDDAEDFDEADDDAEELDETADIDPVDDTDPETADDVSHAPASSDATQPIDNVTIVASWGPPAPDMESIDITLPARRAPSREATPRRSPSERPPSTAARSSQEHPDRPPGLAARSGPDRPTPRPAHAEAGQYTKAPRNGPGEPEEPDPLTDEPSDPEDT